MATPEDLRANAEYIRLADEVVDVPGGVYPSCWLHLLRIHEAV
jgi:acetyl-CoA carboxylase/biotin carboxylase 1